MLNLYWSRTSGGPESGLPFGPLRFRAWTSSDETPTEPESGLPFGPLRFRAWTTGDEEPPEPPVTPPGGGSGFLPGRLPLSREDFLRMRRLQDDELLMWIVAASVINQDD